MFDFFKDVVLEIQGIDSNAVRQEKKEKREQEKADRFIFSKSAKVWVIALAVLYVIMAGVSIVTIAKAPTVAVGAIIKFVVMAILAIAVIFALAVGKKKGEIVALVGAFIFVCMLFVSVVFM